MTEQRAVKWIIALVPLVALLTYFTTMCRSVYWGDGIELTCVAVVLGVGHPTGYPLFSLLGKLFTQLPLGTIAFRMNLMSAVTASVLATLVAWTVWHLFPLVGLTGPEHYAGRRHSPAHVRIHHPDRVLIRAAFAAAAGWTVAFSQDLWYEAGLTEVYLLNAAIFAGAFALVVQAIAGQQSRYLLAAWLICAVGIGNHTMAAMLLVPPLVVLTVWFAVKAKGKAESRRHHSPWIGKALLRQLLRIGGPALSLGIVGVAIYAYVPLRALKNPPLNWGDPSSASRFLWSVRAGEFRRFHLLKVPQWLYPSRPIAPGTPFDSRTYAAFLNYRIGEWLEWTGDQVIALPHEQVRLCTIMGIIILFVAVMGLRLIARKQLMLAVFLAMVVALNLIAVCIYTIPDIGGYFFPAHVIVVICSIVVLARAHRWVEYRLLVHRSDLLAYLVVAFLIAACSRARAFCNHSHYDLPERYGREVLDQLPPNAMILTRGDYDIHPLWYQQIVERRRRDVVVCGANFLATPGYAKYFDDRYQPPVVLKFFEQTPLEEEYFKVLAQDIIAPNLRLRPVYSTWYDPRMGVAADPIEIAVLGNEKERIVSARLQGEVAAGAEESEYFPQPFIYRLHAPGVRP